MIRAALLAAICALATIGSGLAQAAFPGKPGPIAYSKVRYDATSQGDGGLFTHGPRLGQRPSQLTSNGYDRQPAYSADGNWIVLVSKSDLIGPETIEVMRSDGSERRPVVAAGSRPAFFPSGRVIAFVRSVRGRRQVFTVQIDGSGLRQLTSGPSENFDPVVSPSGGRIAFVSTRNRTGRDRTDIFTMRADGSAVRPAIAGPGNEREPDWAPNGRRIAYVVGADLLVARANGRRPICLTLCDNVRYLAFGHPAFSPDGRHLVAHSESDRFVTRRIEVFRSDGRGDPKTFDEAVGEGGEGTFLGVPTWGPRLR